MIVKSNSYLIFASLFAFAVVDQILVSLNSDILLLQYLLTASFVATYIILIYVASEYTNHRLPVKMVFWYAMGFIVFFLTIILKTLIFNGSLNQDWDNLRILVGQVLTVTTGFLLIYSLKSSRLVVKTSRTKFILKAWFTVGLIILISGIIRFVFYGYVWFQLVILSSSNNFKFILGFSENIGVLSTAFLAVIASIIAIFYPEAMLLSQVQIIKAAKIYKLLEKIDDEESNLESLSVNSPDSLIEYVNMIPKIKKRE